GPERVPPALPPVRRVPHPRILSADRRDAAVEAMTTGTTKTRSARRSTKKSRCSSCTLAAFVSFVVLCLAGSAQVAGPIVVVETSKGTFEFEPYPAEAPKTVAHVVALVKGGFYDGQRIHRALPGFLVQWGGPRSRDAARDDDWGRGAEASSGTPIGVAEISSKHLNRRGAVAMA